MKYERQYKFLGQPDQRFPNLVNGEVYTLRVVDRKDGSVQLIFPDGRGCLYASQETFQTNWQESVPTASSK